MTTNGGSYEEVEEACEWIRREVAGHTAKIAIICGSGLGGLANAVRNAKTIPYSQIPGFGHSTVTGHAGQLVFGELQRVPVVCMVGRLHFYEGHSPATITFPIKVLCQLGISTLIVTNAAGGLNKDYKVGDLMMLSDHINLPGLTGAVQGLRGPNDERFEGPRFLALSDAYDLDLRRNLLSAAIVCDLSPPHEGTYAYVSGPNYETRAESRMLRALGADAVGMSTVPEVLMARHLGMKVLALSLITNAVVMDPPPSAYAKSPQPDQSAGKANHEEVMEAGRQAAAKVERLIATFVKILHTAI